MAASTGLAHDVRANRRHARGDSRRRFVLDVANDPAWLLLRLETFAGGSVPADISPAERDARLAELAPMFTDRIVLFVDAHEVRAADGQYLPPPAEPENALATFRLDRRDAARRAHLRWLYGLVADPYPLEIRQPDGSSTD